MTPMETRVLEAFELRFDGTEGGKQAFTGRLVPYDTWAQIGDRFEERMSPGVFKKSTQEAASRLPLMVQHEHQALPVGSVVEWDDREDGLYGRWELADTTEARSIGGLIRDGHVSGLSAGFVPVRSEWAFADQPGEMDQVTRLEARLAEASVVSIPAYQDALILTRTAEGRGPKGTPRLDSWAKWLESAR